ncbi:MAG: hypothetical protein HY400_00525 [Elusimicrobia bacterium]|nr:hypothetical protein [Elusimicrobiota bacterium]
MWYWRTRAKDPAGLYGVWSSTFSVLIDTHTPPGPVTSMTASLGPANGFISLLWTFPGDDKGRVDNGRYRIRFSTSGSILTEGAWSGIIEERNSLFSANPGENVQSIVTGLSDAATYFFAVKTEDELGNLSPLSAVSPFAMTNASPTVALLSPNGGEFIQMITTISWNQSDPNLGDVLTKALRYSSDGGANFSVLIASGIATGTTFYLWDSRGVPNTVSGRIKIEVVDQRGFSAADASNGNFQVDNVNEAPVVQWSSAPANAQEVSGVLTVSWSVADPNLLDTHAYSVLLSPDSGGSFFTLASGISQSSHTFNTAVFSNLTTYRLKVVATDSGTPVLSGEALSPVFSIVNTLPPNSFNLLSPLQLDFPSVFDLKFSWEAASDPEGGAVSYRLQYSTVSGPADGTVVSGLNQTNYTPALNSLLMDTEYFWQVTALDPYLRETQSTVGRFTLSRLKSKTSDRFLQVEVLSGMPANGYLDFQNAVVSYSDLLARAEEDSKADRLKKVLSYPTWQIQVKDISGNTLSSDGIAARLTYNFSTNSSNSEQIKIAKLNQSLGRWEVLSSPQTYDSSARQLTATVQGFSVFNVIASVTPSQTLSGVTNFPNPFAAGKETTRIRYVLTQDSKVTIRFYTLLGDLVRVLEFEPGSSGGTGIPVGYTNEVTWDGKNGGGQTVANGMYIAQIRAESSEGIVTEIRRIGVLK